MTTFRSTRWSAVNDGLKRSGRAGEFEIAAVSVPQDDGLVLVVPYTSKTFRLIELWTILAQVPVENHDGSHSIRTAEGCGHQVSGAISNLVKMLKVLVFVSSLWGVRVWDLDVKGDRVFGDVLGEVAHCVEHGLFVELVGAGVDDDWRVHKVTRPIGAAVFVQRQVPVDPTRHPVVQVLYGKRKHAVALLLILIFSLRAELRNATWMMSTA